MREDCGYFGVWRDETVGKRGVDDMVVEKRENIYSFMGLKVIAMLAIFVWHVGVEIPISGDLGARGVEIFILISGFLAYYTQKEISSYDNWKKKFVSVWPLHLLCFFVAYWMAPVKISQYGKSAVITIFLNVFLLQDFSESVTTFNWVSWYLCVYLLCALLAPVFLKIIDKSYKKAIIIGSVSLLVRYFLEAWQQYGFWELKMHYAPLVRVMEFLMAMCVGCICMHIQDIKKIKSKSAWFVLELIWIIIFILVQQESWIRFYYILVELVLIAVFFLEPKSGLCAKVMGNKVFEALSKIQLEFYMFHQLVIRILRSKVTGTILLPLLSFAITLLISWGYKLLLEQRLKRILEIVFEHFEKKWKEYGQGSSSKA